MEKGGQKEKENREIEEQKASEKDMEEEEEENGDPVKLKKEARNESTKKNKLD